jgi:hypothetical protein
MSVDAKCYECISGAGLEPILDKRYINSKTPFTLAKEYSKDVLKGFQEDPSVPPSMKDKLGVAMGLSGGRGQASGFIMRMMAENKKKHQGQYKNPSNNDYGSTMKTFAPFDYKRLANANQNGEGEGEIGASPFIQKHFGSPEAVPFITKAQRGSEEHRVVAGETEAQKAARLQAKSEQLAKLAKDLLEKSGATDKAKGKVKGFLKGRVAIKQAKKELEARRQIKKSAETGIPTAASTKEASDLYLASYRAVVPHHVMNFKWSVERDFAIKKGNAKWFCLIGRTYGEYKQFQGIKASVGINLNTVIKDESMDFQRGQRVSTIKYLAPNNEIEVFYNNEKLSADTIDNVEIINLENPKGNWYIQSGDHGDIDLHITFKGSHRVFDKLRRFSTYNGKENDRKLSVSLREVDETLSNKLSNGYWASLLFRFDEYQKAHKEAGDEYQKAKGLKIETRADLKEKPNEKKREYYLSNLKRNLRTYNGKIIYKVLYNGKEYVARHGDDDEEEEEE